MTTKAVETVQRELYETELNDSQVSEKRNAALLKLGFVLTFLLYLVFNQHLYLGDATGWSEYLKDGASMSGFAFLMTITVLMALFLAGVKHHLYLHFGVAGQVLYVVVLLIGFALLAEMFSTSASQDVKSRIMLTKDDAYQQTLKNSTTPAILGDSKLTADIATARRKLAQCRERLKQGREPHCKGSAATLHSLMESERNLMTAQKQVSVEGQKLNHDRQDKLKADSYNPVVVTTAKLLAGVFGGEYGDYVKQAIMVLMMLVAITFEVLHHFLSKVHGETKRHINEMTLQLASMDDRKLQDNSQIETKQESNQPFGFNQPVGAATTAQLSRFKYQDEPLIKGEPVPNNQPFGFAPSSKAELPVKAMPGGTGKHNPVLGRSEQHYELPLDEPVQVVTVPPESDVKKAGAKGTAVPLKQGTAVPSDDGLYSEWVKAVNAGQCRPSTKQTWSFIQKRIAGVKAGNKTNTPKRITSMQNAFFYKAVHDGFAINNPKYTHARCGHGRIIWKGGK